MEFGLKKKRLYAFEIYRGGGLVLHWVSKLVFPQSVHIHTRSYYLLQAGGECFCVFQCVVFVLKRVLCLHLFVKWNCLCCCISRLILIRSSITVQITVVDQNTWKWAFTVSITGSCAIAEPVSALQTRPQRDNMKPCSSLLYFLIVFFTHT